MIYRPAGSRRRSVRRWVEKTLAFWYRRVPLIAVVSLALYGCSHREKTTAEEGPSPERSPAEEAVSFQTAPGLTAELVAAEPMVEDPVVCTFDEDGRLWVVEMRAYMPDVEGTGERQPIGRVSVLEDTDDDGTMDRSTVYLDSLIMPRALAVTENGALVVWEEALWMTRDFDGDLVADSRTLIDPAYAGSQLPEHSPNGLWRGIDNWYYNAKSRFRYRLIAGEWKKDSTEFRGQWGISHDDAGRLYYNYNWSQLHADLVPPNYLTRNRNHTPVTGIDYGLTLDRRVYPIRPTPAVNRGYIPGILDDEQKLKEFTAACSPLVYRGTALPGEFYGNVFVCEPSGNLIKRNVIKAEGLHLAAVDPHPGKEFLASTDERFRPVHLAQGPDGALYVADMYRGLIQHKAYVTPYLREQSLSRKLIQPIHRGRIWRITSENRQHPRTPKLSRLTTEALVAYLSHPDGWYRDMAQRLLIERGDALALPSLRQLALKGEEALGRFHALWTLEGLNGLTSGILFSALGDPDPHVSATALRLLEPIAVADNRVRRQLEETLLRTWRNAPLQLVLQMTFAAGVLEESVSHQLLSAIATRYDTSAVIREAILSSIPNQELAFMEKLLSLPEWGEQKPAREIFLETLTSSVVRKRDTAEMSALLSMLNVSADAFGWREKAILTGMSIQGYGGGITPVRLTAEPSFLKRRDLGIPASQLDGLASLFEWPGSISRDTLSQQENALNDDQKEQFALGRKLYLSSCSGCHGNDGGGLTRFAPPLRGSEWVLGDARRLTLLVLHGLEGPLEVAGKRYAEPEILPVMPGHSTLDDEALAAILTYIRNEWGNHAGAVSRRTVGGIRLTNQGRVLPWTAEELNAHVGSMTQEEDRD